MTAQRRRFRINLRFLLLLTLGGAFYFLGWSTHQSQTRGRFQRAQYSAQRLQDEWYRESEMIRRSTTRSAPGVSVENAMRLLEQDLSGSEGDGEASP